MIAFPNSPGTYINFWKKLAEHQINILHSDDKKNFVLINKNHDPFLGKWDLTELTDGLVSKISLLYAEQQFCMALVNAETENNPTPGVQNIRAFDGGFIILTKVSPGSEMLTDKMNAFNDTFNIGTEMMAWKSEYLNLTRGQWQNFKYGTEQVMGSDGLVGTAFIFNYGVRTGISYTAANFNNYIPSTS